MKQIGKEEMRKSKYGNRGKFLESLVDYANEVYKTSGKGIIAKTHPPVTVLKWVKKSIFQGFFSGKAVVDYVGCVNGQFIAFDAKEANCKKGSGKSFPLSNISEHQLSYLKSVKENGGIAFFVIMFGTEKGELFYICPLDVVINKIESGKKSIKITDLTGYEIPVMRGYIDYLETVKKEINENYLINTKK